MTYAAQRHAGSCSCDATAQRDFRERLRLRLGLLAGPDRALMTMYLDAGHSYRQLARLTGSSPTTVARKIHRIARRLADETYPLCLRCRSEFSILELHIIKDHFVRGLSCSRISRTRNLSTYRVRAAIGKAKQHREESKCKKQNANLRKSSPRRGDSAILILDS